MIQVLKILKVQKGFNMFSLKSFLELNEKDDKINSLISYIVKNYNEEEIVSKIEKKAIDEYVPNDWETKAKDEIEWYEKYGRGEAEEDIIKEIIQEASRRKSVTLSATEYADLQNWFYNAFSL